MRKLSIGLLIIGLAAMFLGPSFAAQKGVPLPARSGLYMWSAEAGQFLKIDRIVEGVRQSQNQLFRRVFSLEQRIKALERD